MNRPPRWFARSEPINWFDVIRDACALAYVLTVGIVAVALVVGILVALFGLNR